MYTYMLYCVYVFSVILLAIISRICFLIFFKYNTKRKIEMSPRTTPVKTMIILGSGGHTAEMLRIVGQLDLKNYSPRIYVHANTDNLSADKVQELEVGQTDYKVIQVCRSREPLMESYTPVLQLVPWKLLLEDIQKHVPLEIKAHIEPIAYKLANYYENTGDLSLSWIENSQILVEACLDKTWEILNSGYWKDVPIEYRYCYSACTIAKAVLMELQYEKTSVHAPKEKEAMAKAIIKHIDKGILLGAPLPKMSDLLTTIASNVNTFCSHQEEIKSTTEINIDSESISNDILPGFLMIPHYDEPSMESFYKNLFMLKAPGLLRGCIQHWKALKQWKNLDYLDKIAGTRTVPIELGSRYTEDDWTQRLINFSEFLQKHISRKNDEVGYLAQHQLFDQIPELKDDFSVPEYCNFSDNEEPEIPDINAWFGPAGTVSPLHFDPKNNLLCQVFGSKRIVLYNPDDTPNLYPYDTRLLNNTAQVDPMNPNYEKWPDFRKARGLMCYLKPGEMLYIPPKWWHHVTALTPSFSISFWWD